MEKLREWGFPVALMVGWMFAATYTVSLLIGPEATPVPATSPASISDSTLPAS
jgi:hypothetical protein